MPSGSPGGRIILIPKTFFFPFPLLKRRAGRQPDPLIDPDLDRLIETAQRTTSEIKRYRLYQQAEDRIVRNAPWVFMWHRADYYVIQPWVKDFKIYPIYSIDKRVDITLNR